MQPFIIRCAHIKEVSAMNALILASSNELGQGYYTPDEIAGLNHYVFGVDQELIDDHTYFVMEINGSLAGCGGWSKRRTLFGGDQASTRIPGYLDPQTEAAKIRAFFIHPKYARQGLATALLLHCELEAHKAGFTALELMSTLPGIPFYKQQGYISTGDYTLALPNGLQVKLVPMQKMLNY